MTFKIMLWKFFDENGIINPCGIVVFHRGNYCNKNKDDEEGCNVKED